jgi:hypothetical protein
MKALFTFLFSVLITALSYPQSDLDILVKWMTGSFSSEEQANVDTNYFNIELEMVQIWKDRTDGPWIYVEQAVAEYKDKPYRQRVYQLTKRNDGKIESIVYSIPNSIRFAGDYKQKIPLLKLVPDSLVLREGCKVILYRADEGYFEGSTVDKNCNSELRGASYATSEVLIKADRLISWDRGFDENDNQVWGAEKGGYIFMKRKNNLIKISPGF